jgi:hypothetical protein
MRANGAAGVGREDGACGRGHLERARELRRRIPARGAGTAQHEVDASRPEAARQSAIRRELPLDGLQHGGIAGDREPEPDHVDVS